MAKRDAAPTTAPAVNDAYTGMLAVSLLALIAGCVFLYLDFSQYPDTQGPKSLSKAPQPVTPQAVAPGNVPPAVVPPVAVPKAVDPVPPKAVDPVPPKAEPKAPDPAGKDDPAAPKAEPKAPEAGVLKADGPAKLELDKK